jgi:hypothetical protein
MIVVVDANAIIRDYRLTGRGWRVLLGQAAEEDVSLVIPEVVMLEVLKHYRSDLQKTASSAEKFDRMTQDYPDRRNPDFARQVADYELHLRQKLGDVGATFPSPNVELIDVAKRHVERRRPFKSSGAGYPDVLIWELCKELAEENAVTLLSDNHTDFGGDDDGGLDPALEHELENLGRGGKVTRLPTASDFNRQNLPTAAAYTTELAQRLDQHAEYLDGLKRELWEPIAESGEFRGMGDIATAETTRADDVEVEEVALLEVIDIGEGRFYATLETTGTARLEFPMLQGDAWSDWDEGYLEDYSLNAPDEPYGDAVAFVHFEAIVDADYDPRTGALSAFEVSDLVSTPRQVRQPIEN